MTSPTFDILTGSRWGVWPKPGDDINSETANTLMDIYERLCQVEELQTKFYTRMDHIPMHEEARSDNRQEFMAYIWEVLDIPVPLKVARAA